MFQAFLGIVQPTLAVLLIAVILLQQKGTGLGAAFGGGGNIYSTKRGIDKVLFQTTIVLSVALFGTAIASLIFS